MDVQDQVRATEFAYWTEFDLDPGALTDGLNEVLEHDYVLEGLPQTRPVGSGGQARQG